MKDLSMQFLNLTNFIPLSHLKVKLLMKTGERRIMIKVVAQNVIKQGRIHGYPSRVRVGRSNAVEGH